eukprot:11997936-Alexandrium_andersonii.AAC.1
MASDITGLAHSPRESRRSVASQRSTSQTRRTKGSDSRSQPPPREEPTEPNRRARGEGRSTGQT